MAGDIDPNDIVDDTLDALRDQADDQGEQTFKGTVPVNPQAFAGGGNHLVIGPIDFDSPFAEPPNMTFGQVQIGQPVEGILATNVATLYTPFLVQPYVFKLNIINGYVEGFYLGLYALTTPPASVYSHSVSWRAEGKATAFADSGTSDENWTEPFDQNDPDFLTEDAGEQYIDE